MMLRGVIICPDVDLNERLEALLNELGDCEHHPDVGTVSQFRWSCCAWCARMLPTWSS